MFEATEDGMQVMAGEDPRVAVNTVTSKPGPPKNAYKSKEIQTATRDKRPARQMWTVVPTSYKRYVQPRMNPATNVTN